MGYDENLIKTLDIIEAMRKRPGMYIGAADINGILHLINELVTNATDEFISGRSTNVFIKLQTNPIAVTVWDDGFGIPVSKLEEVIMKAHSGGKFDSAKSGATAGLHGVGLTAVNSMSKNVIIASKYQFGQKKASRTITTKKGIKQTDVNSSKITEMDHGLYIYFEPDPEVFRGIKSVDESFVNRLYDLLDAKASINQGFALHLEVDGGKPKHFAYTDGIIGFLAREFPRPSMIVKKNSVEGFAQDPNGSKSIQFAFNFSFDSGNLFRAFINGLETPDQKSTHISGVVSGVAAAMLESAKVHGLEPKFHLSDIRECIFGVIISTQIEPEFSSQTKTEFTSNEHGKFAKRVAAETMKHWIDTNANKFRDIVKAINNLIKSKERLEKDKSVSMAAISKLSDVETALTNPEAYSPCTSYENSELFIVEGVSAGGNLITGRDNKRQALFYLRGKLYNSLRKQEPDTRMKDLITVLQCGFGERKNVDKCVFEKIIIATDADVDGLHIRSLLMMFFFLHYVELIQQGRLYAAEPPLYQVTLKNGKNYDFIDIEEYEMFKYTYFLLNYGIGVVKKGKFVELGTKDACMYLSLIRPYYKKMEDLSKVFVIEPSLLEYVVRNQEKLFDKKHFKEVAKPPGGYKLSVENTLLLFDKGMNHYEIDKSTLGLGNLYNDVKAELDRIRYAGLVMFDRASKEIYTPETIYETSKIFNTYLESSAKNILRNKGLGEMTPNDLKFHTLDPNTRSIRQITMSDAKAEVKKARETIEMFFGADTTAKKEYHFGIK